MPYDWTRLTETTIINAASLNSRFDAVRNEMNALEDVCVQPRALHRTHLPTTVLSKGRAEIISPISHTYTNVAEPYPGYGLSAGWKVINTNGSLGTGTPLSITLSSAVNLSQQTRFGGILVLANVHAIAFTGAGVTVGTYQASAMFAIQYQISGTWYTLGRSERFLSAETNADGTSQLALFKDVPIRTYIKYADVAGKGNETVTDIRMVTSINNVTAPLKTLALRQGQITAIAIRAGTI